MGWILRVDSGILIESGQGSVPKGLQGKWKDQGSGRVAARAPLSFRTILVWVSGSITAPAAHHLSTTIPSTHAHQNVLVYIRLTPAAPKSTVALLQLAREVRYLLIRTCVDGNRLSQTQCGRHPPTIQLGLRTRHRCPESIVSCGYLGPSSPSGIDIVRKQWTVTKVRH